MPQIQFSQTIELLQRLVRRAGDLLRRRLSAVHQVHYKGEKNLVTEMDRAVEAVFVKNIRRFFPGHEVLSEEMAESAAAPAGFPRPTPGKPRWIIDPLDGTTNYAHGFPHFGVSAGIELNGEIILGAVYNPMLGEFFFAQRGQGAWLNNRRIRVSTVRRLDRALLATGFPYDLGNRMEKAFSDFIILSLRGQALRRAGSASLDLCDVACGRFDGFWEYLLKPWDVAAGALIITEAGGRITDYAGRRFDLYGDSFLASNGRLHPAMAKVLRGKVYFGKNCAETKAGCGCGQNAGMRTGGGEWKKESFIG